MWQNQEPKDKHGEKWLEFIVIFIENIFRVFWQETMLLCGDVYFIVWQNEYIETLCQQKSLDLLQSALCRSSHTNNWINALSLTGQEMLCHGGRIIFISLKNGLKARCVFPGAHEDFRCEMSH